MAQWSRIEWTGSTWNPVVGCTKVSAGCKNCYAERMAKRLPAMARADRAAGQKPPSDHVIDGRNLMPLLTQAGPLGRAAIYWHFPHYRGSGDVVPYSIIRHGDWKLIKRYEGKPFGLFNLRDDIGEQCDLSGEMPEKVSELDARLTAWLERSGARLPKPNPDYEPER